MTSKVAYSSVHPAWLLLAWVVSASTGSLACAGEAVWPQKGDAEQPGQPAAQRQEKTADSVAGRSLSQQEEQLQQAQKQAKNPKQAKKPKIELPPKRAVPKPGPEAVLLAAHSVAGQIPVKSWKRLRDQNIVKQDQDFSCGAASLATLLNNFYGQNTTEEAILKAMAKEDGMASFEDMARVMPKFGFRAQGFAASWEQLTRLKIPVVVYVKHRKDDHFSVLRGIDRNTVWLADPSLGNRTYSREQFLEMWQTREDKSAPALAGKFLAILPAQHESESDAAKLSAERVGTPIKIAQGYFSKTPRRQSGIAVEQLSVRAGWR